MEDTLPPTPKRYLSDEEHAEILREGGDEELAVKRVHAVRSAG